MASNNDPPRIYLPDLRDRLRMLQPQRSVASAHIVQEDGRVAQARGNDVRGEPLDRLHACVRGVAVTTEPSGLVGLLVGEGLLRERPVAAVALESVESIRGANGEESLISDWTCRGAPEGLHGVDSDGVENCLLFINVKFLPAVWLE